MGGCVRGWGGRCSSSLGEALPLLNQPLQPAPSKCFGELYLFPFCERSLLEQKTFCRHVPPNLMSCPRRLPGTLPELVLLVRAGRVLLTWARQVGQRERRKRSFLTHRHTPSVGLWEGRRGDAARGPGIGTCNRLSRGSMTTRQSDSQRPRAGAGGVVEGGSACGRSFPCAFRPGG